MSLSDPSFYGALPTPFSPPFYWGFVRSFAVWWLLLRWLQAQGGRSREGFDNKSLFIFFKKYLGKVEISREINHLFVLMEILVETHAKGGFYDGPGCVVYSIWRGEFRKDGFSSFSVEMSLVPPCTVSCSIVFRMYRNLQGELRRKRSESFRFFDKYRRQFRCPYPYIKTEGFREKPSASEMQIKTNYIPPLLH